MRWLAVIVCFMGVLFLSFGATNRVWTVVVPEGTNPNLFAGGGTIGGSFSNLFWVNKGGTDQTSFTLTSWTQLTFTNALLNVGGCWNTTSNQFTAPVTGVYQFGAYISTPDNNYVRLTATLGIYTNGTLHILGASCFNTYAYSATVPYVSVLFVTPPITLSSGDTIKLYERFDGQTGDTNPDVDGDIQATYFTGWKLE